MATGAKVRRYVALNDDAAAGMRRAILEVAGEDAALRDRLLLRFYETFLRGMGDEGYGYSHTGREAARAALGLADEADAEA